MRYLSLVFASMLLVGCAQSTEVQTSTEDVDIQSQEQSSEPEVETNSETESQPSEEPDEPTETNTETEPEPTTETTEPAEPTEPETGANQSEASEEMEAEEPVEEMTEEPAEEPAPETEEVEPEPTGFTLAMVQENDDASSCWSVINGNVYDLTDWINQHPGGSSRILGLCGTDGSSSFNAMHGGQSNPESRLQSFLLGPLS